MKKIQTVLAALILAAFVFQGAALAGTVAGTVNSVDSAMKKLEISAADGTSSSVSYGDTTTWPAGVTDPSTLVGKKVSVTTDDATGSASLVSEVTA